MKHKASDHRLSQAREHAKKRQYHEALELNSAVFRDAEPNSYLSIYALRFIGLCHYRLEQYPESERTLAEARVLAEAAGEKALSLFIVNHLGATVRRLGRPDEALQLFLDGLKEASDQAFLEPRARLLGNLGALYDEAGQRALADDAYARYEEVWQFLGDKHRLANARGLMSRAECLRGRLNEAEWRVEEEERLAKELGDETRRQAAATHRVAILLAQAQATYSEQRAELLERAKEQAERLLFEQSLPLHTRVSVECALARAMVQLGQPSAALLRLQELLNETSSDTRHEPRAQLLQEMATVSSQLWLHGEALHFLIAALQLRNDALSRIKDRESAKRLFQPRFQELQELAKEILNTAHTVSRSDKEREAVDSLLQQLSAEPAPSWPEPRLSNSRRQDAETHWIGVLGEKNWQAMSPLSRNDILTSEVVYHGAVDDLGRTAHLLVVVFERELRARFLHPVEKLFEELQPTPEEDSELKGIYKKLEEQAKPSTVKKPRPIFLHEQIKLVKAILKPKPSDSFLSRLREAVAPDAERWEKIANFHQPVVDAQQQQINPQTVRNGVAHGFDKLTDQPTRLQVDAIRRFLLLNPKSPLLHLLQVDLNTKLAASVRSSK